MTRLPNVNPTKGAIHELSAYSHRALLSGAVSFAPVYAGCPAGPGPMDQRGVGTQTGDPCFSSNHLVLAAIDDTTAATTSAFTSSAYQEQRVAHPNGLGFGPLVATLPGIMGFYDRTLNASSQLHAQISFSAGRSESTYGNSSVAVDRLSALVTYRRFFSPESGFYYGGGLGYSRNTLKYEYDDLFSTNSTTYKASGQGIIALAEIGWQGDKGYYFHAGFQPTMYLNYDDDYDYDENAVPDISNHRRVANEDWGKSKRPSAIAVGFGWFF